MAPSQVFEGKILSPRSYLEALWKPCVDLVAPRKLRLRLQQNTGVAVTLHCQNKRSRLGNGMLAGCLGAHAALVLEASVKNFFLAGL